MIKVIKSIYLLTFLNYLSLSFGQQNLVPNPDFEIYSTCGTFITYATSWDQPTDGTSDYLNACFSYVPLNFYGYQNSFNGGAGYVGLFAYYKWPTTYREYVQAKLTMTLEVGQKYFASCYVSLADSSRYATDDFGIFISQNQISLMDYDAFGFTPQVSNPQGQFLNNKNSWVRIFGSFIASGGEEYITIGNFKFDSNTDTISTTPPYVTSIDSNAAYYYVDHVCLSTDSVFCYVPEISLGLNNLTDDKDLFFFSDNKIFVMAGEVYSIQIFDIYGCKKIENSFDGRQSIDISYLDNGCYIVILNSSKRKTRKKVFVYK